MRVSREFLYVILCYNLLINVFHKLLKKEKKLHLKTEIFSFSFFDVLF